jgi:hypothetical protein
MTPNELSPQQQSILLTQTLARSVKFLTDNNYILWASFIRTGLKSMFLSNYLNSDEIKMEDSHFDDGVSRACITTWILNNMDDLNRARFEPKITIYKDSGPDTQNLPAKLWKAITTHHSSRTKEHCLLLEQSLNLIVQGPNLPLLTHLQHFQDAVTKYKTAGGQMSDEDLGRKLLISLNNQYFQDAKEIAISGVKDYDKVVFELKKRVDVVTMLTNGPMAPTQWNVIDHAAQAGFKSNSFFRYRSKNKCTRTKCTGINHEPDKCFKKAGNEHLQREWIEQRVRLGQWDGKPLMHFGNDSSSATGSQGEPLIEQAENAFDSLNASASNISCQSLSKLPFGDKLDGTEVLIDTAASHHMFKERHVFINYVDLMHRNDYLDIGGCGVALKIHGRGNVQFVGRDGYVFELNDCLYIPDIKRSLIAGTILLNDNFIIRKEKNLFVIDKDGHRAFEGVLHDGIRLLRSYVSLVFAVIHNVEANTITSTTNSITLNLHHCLGHPKIRYLKSMVSKDSVKGENVHVCLIPDHLSCDSCDLAKGHRVPHNHYHV